jgi:hypothetical protein
VDYIRPVSINFFGEADLPPKKTSQPTASSTWLNLFTAAGFPGSGQKRVANGSFRLQETDKLPSMA